MDYKISTPNDNGKIPLSVFDNQFNGGFHASVKLDVFQAREMINSLQKGVSLIEDGFACALRDGLVEFANRTSEGRTGKVVNKKLALLQAAHQLGDNELSDQIQEILNNPPMVMKFELNRFMVQWLVKCTLWDELIAADSEAEAARRVELAQPVKDSIVAFQVMGDSKFYRIFVKGRQR